MRKSVAVGLLIALVTSPVLAEVDGDGWRRLDPVNQAAYMQGVLDVGTSLEQFGREDAKNKGQSVREYWNSQGILGFYASTGCNRVSKMPAEQKLAILQAYVNDKPDLWDSPMTLIIQDAFGKLCEEWSSHRLRTRLFSSGAANPIWDPFIDRVGSVAIEGKLATRD